MFSEEVGGSSRAYLKLDLGLGSVELGRAVGSLLGLGDRVADVVGTEAVHGVGLDGVDAHDRVGLHNGEASGD